MNYFTTISSTVASFSAVKNLPGQLSHIFAVCAVSYVQSYVQSYVHTTLCTAAVAHWFGTGNNPK